MGEYWVINVYIKVYCIFIFWFGIFVYLCKMFLKLFGNNLKDIMKINLLKFINFSDKFVLNIFW